MVRRTFILSSGASLTVCLMLLALALRSFWIQDIVFGSWESQPRIFYNFELYSTTGVLYLHCKIRDHTQASAEYIQELRRDGFLGWHLSKDYRLSAKAADSCWGTQPN